MRRLVVAEFVTLDGVMEAPGFEEHRDGKNALALRMQTEQMQGFIREQFASVAAFLLGRTTYQIWAAFWPPPDGVRDLATGTDLVFSPLGSVGLRGVPGRWELFEASTG